MLIYLSFFAAEEYALMPSIFEVEDYDKCMQMKEKALYCYIKFELKPLDRQNTSKTWKIIKVKIFSLSEYFTLKQPVLFFISAGIQFITS